MNKKSYLRRVRLPRTSTPIKFMPGYLGGYCLPVYLFGEVVLQCRHTM